MGIVEMDFEIKRKIIHTATAIAAVPFLLFFSFVTGAIIALVGLGAITLVWWLDRRGRVLKGPAAKGQEILVKTMENTMREGEEYPWASVYFLAGLLLVAGLSDWLAVPLWMAFAAYAVLGVGDAASALIGKAYGNNKIPWNKKKSWEGTGAGIGSAYPWAMVLASIYFVVQDVVPSVHVPWIVLVGTVAGMLAETLPGEDNFTIPVTSWLTMWVLGLLMGLV